MEHFRKDRLSEGEALHAPPAAVCGVALPGRRVPACADRGGPYAMLWRSTRKELLCVRSADDAEARRLSRVCERVTSTQGETRDHTRVMMI